MEPRIINFCANSTLLFSLISSVGFFVTNALASLCMVSSAGNFSNLGGYLILPSAAYCALVAVMFAGITIYYLANVITEVENRQATYTVDDFVFKIKPHFSLLMCCIIITSIGALLFVWWVFAGGEYGATPLWTSPNAGFHIGIFFIIFFSLLPPYCIFVRYKIVKRLFELLPEIDDWIDEVSFMRMMTFLGTDEILSQVIGLKKIPTLFKSK